MKILAIDYGTKRIGFAIGNTAIDTAAPINPLWYKKKNQPLEYISEIIDQYEIDTIVIGYPLNMDGTKSITTETVERFGANLKKRLSPEITIEYIDERLSSFEAEEELKNSRPNFKRKKEIMDSMSAMMILRRYMEKI